MRWKRLAVGGIGGAVLLAGWLKHVTLAQAQGRWAVRAPEAPRIGVTEAFRQRRSALDNPRISASRGSSEMQQLRELLVRTQQHVSQLAADEHAARQTIARLRAALAQRDDHLEQLSRAFERAWATDRTRETETDTARFASPAAGQEPPADAAAPSDLRPSEHLN